MAFSTNNLVSFEVTDDSFTAGSTKFFIYDEKMAFEKLSEFQSVSQKIISGKSVSDTLKFTQDIYNTLRSETSALAANGDAQKMIFNFLKTVENRSVDSIMDQSLEDIYDLCCCFIYTKDEDMSVHDPELQTRKKNIWKKHCDSLCFFFLSMSRLPQLAERLKRDSQNLKKKTPTITDSST